MNEIPQEIKEKIVTDDAVRFLAAKFKFRDEHDQQAFLARRALEDELIPLLDFSPLMSDD